MEKGLAYKVEVFYKYYCARTSNDKVSFLTNGKMYDQLDKIKHNFNLHEFIEENVKISDELTAKHVIYFSYGKFVIIA